MVKRVLCALAIAALCQGSADCCDERPTLLAVDDFEQCEAPLCGWRVEAGMPEQVATFHAGEHGLRMDGGTRIAKDYEPFEDERAVTELDLLVDCDDEARLVLVNPDGADSNVEVGSRGSQNRVLERRVVAVVDQESTIRLEARGDGSCLVDDVRLIARRMGQCE